MVKPGVRRPVCREGAGTLMSLGITGLFSSGMQSDHKSTQVLQTRKTGNSPYLKH